MRRQSWVWLAGSALLLAIVLAPYGVAWRAQPPGFVFSGFLVNPIDGFSYLAKMRQGAGGSWLFRLPYAAEPGAGALLFLYYLFLGHVTRIVAASPLVVYHAARILGTAAMLLASYVFYRATMTAPAARRWAMGLTLFGSGLGWIGIAAAGRLPVDLWVPEAIPFYSAFANAHFPLSAAAMLTALTAFAAPDLRRGVRIACAALAGLVLALVQPFAVVGVASVAIVWGVWSGLRPATDSPRSEGWRDRLYAAVAFLAVTLPWLVYDVWVTGSQPALAAWSAQNLTPTPPPIDVLLGYGLLLVLAAISFVTVRPQSTSGGRWLAVWLIVGLVLVFAPFSLQRRMLLGLFFPMAALSGQVLAEMAAGGRARRWLAYGIFVLCIPSNLVVVAASLGGALRQEPEVVLTIAETRAYAWIAANVPPDSLVLAGEVTGNRLPADADVRVRYGHPYETPRAEEELAWVNSIFGSVEPAGEVLAELHEHSIDYVYVGPRERVMGEMTWVAALVPLYEQDGIAIYGLPAP
jgi:hypothetical protein